MSYEHLNKIFYQQENQHAALYSARFNSPTARHFDFILREHNRRHEYPAFLSYTEDLFLLLERVYKKYEQFSQVINAAKPVVLHQFTLECIVDEVKSTNDIEGIRSTRREIQEILNGTNKSVRLEGVVKKYNSLNSGEKFNFTTCADIRKFYDDFVYAEVLSDNKKNKLDGILFRKELVDIDSGTGKVLHRGLHPEERIIDALTIALEILNDEQTPFLIRIAVFHYFFEYIHPFYDGNGRTGRFIVSYYLAEYFHYLAALRLSVTIKKNQKQYYELFRETTTEINCGDLTPFVLGFISIIEETFGEVEDMLIRQSAQLEQYRQILKHKLPTDELTQKIGYLLLQAALFYGGGIPMSQLMEITGVARNTIKDRLRSLPSSYVIQSGSRKLFYKLNLNIFDNV